MLNDTRGPSHCTADAGGGGGGGGGGAGAGAGGRGAAAADAITPSSLLQVAEAARGTRERELLVADKDGKEAKRSDVGCGSSSLLLGGNEDTRRAAGGGGGLGTTTTEHEVY
jgi:hypothetical protein